jgi:hypothetical protein
MKKILALFLAVVCSSSFAGIVQSSVTKVTYLSSYNQYGGGDVTVSVETKTVGCEDGFWLSKSDAGFPANLAMLLSAYHAKTPVMVYGLSDQIWVGSAGKYCKLYLIELR